MRIIAGQYRNRTIKAPNGLLTRPSTDRVRESLFNLVQHRMDLDEARVLDLFAGTGALGLEAISRGARSSTFVELNGKVLRVARANAESLGVERQCLFVRTNAIRFIERSSGATYDLVLADPPYDLDVLTELPERVQPMVAEGGLFVLEHDARHHFDEHPHLDTSRPYGRTIVSIFRFPNPTP